MRIFSFISVGALLFATAEQVGKKVVDNDDEEDDEEVEDDDEDDDISTHHDETSVHRDRKQKDSARKADAIEPILPVLPDGVDCGTSIHPDRMTELIQFFIERDVKDSLRSPFFRSTEGYCYDVCVQGLVELVVDRMDLFHDPISAERDHRFRRLRGNFCIDMAKYSFHGQILVDVNPAAKRMRIPPQSCASLQKIEQYCRKQECDGFHRQCDLVLRREWCRLMNQNRETTSGRALDCFIYFYMRTLAPYKMLVDHGEFDRQLKSVVSHAFEAQAEFLRKECEAAELGSNCSFDEVHEQKLLLTFRLRAADHDGQQCARIQASSPKWMKSVQCICTTEDPCTTRILAREARIEYHRVRFIDLVMLLQRSTEDDQNPHDPEFVCNNGGIMWLATRLSFSIQNQCFPQLFGRLDDQCAYHKNERNHCWSALAAEMIRLLDVDSGAFFRTQIELLFETVFGHNVDDAPQMDRALDTSDYEIFSSVQVTYFRAYLWGALHEKECDGSGDWRLEDLLHLVKELLVRHAESVPLIIHDDVAQNTLYIMFKFLRRIQKMKTPRFSEQGDVPLGREHDDVLTLEAELVRGAEKSHMPPQLSWRASARAYVEGIIHFKLLRVVRLSIDGLLDREKRTQKSIDSALPEIESGKQVERRRMGVRFQYHTFLSESALWESEVLDEASDAGVEYRLREKAFVIERCKQYRIDRLTYVPTDHHEPLPTSYFFNGGLLSECSLQHVLARHYAIQSIDDRQQGSVPKQTDLDMKQVDE